MSIRNRELPPWLLGAGLVIAGVAWVGVAAAVVVTIYAREAVLGAVGLPATLVLVGCFLAPLVAVYAYADRLRVALSDGDPATRE